MTYYVSSVTLNPTHSLTHSSDNLFIYYTSRQHSAIQDTLNSTMTIEETEIKTQCADKYMSLITSSSFTLMTRASAWSGEAEYRFRSCPSAGLCVFTITDKLLIINWCICICILMYSAYTNMYIGICATLTPESDQISVTFDLIFEIEIYFINIWVWRLKIDSSAQGSCCPGLTVK